MSKYPYFKDIHEEVLKVARAASEEFKKRASDADRNADHAIVESNLKRLEELNLSGLAIPREYGGQGLDMVAHTLVVEEIAKVCLSTAFTFSTHTQAMGCIYYDGTDEQKKKYLPALCKDKIGAFALTEPSAGSDPASGKTRAKLQGTEYVLNGSKCFCTGGAIADIIIVFASLDPEKGARGINAFIVEKGTPGLKIGKLEDKMGLRASPTTELFMDNCKVPKDNLLGNEGAGFSIAMNSLNYARVFMGAQCIGLSKAALEAAIAYAKERVQFGQPIIKQQAMQFMIAEMAAKIQAMESLTYHAAWLIDQKEPFAKEAAITKLFNAEAAMWITDKAIQIHGGVGYTKDYLVERYHRDAKIMEIAEGTSEIQKIVISRAVIGR